MTDDSERNFFAEHAAAERLDGPIGGELTSLCQDFELLAAEFTNSGAVDTQAIHMIRAGLDRMEMHGKILALADDLVERAFFLRGLVGRLADDREPGAVERTQMHIDFQMEGLLDIAGDATTGGTGS